LTRNAFANTEQRATLLGIGLYSEGNRPTQQKLCSAPTELLSLIAESPVGGTQATEAERGSRIWIHLVAILSFLREIYAFLYGEKKRILTGKELKAGLIILKIRKKSDSNTLKNCISSS
jgi:hypothetical protein